MPSDSHPGEGLLAVDKPSGPTSHDIVSMVRKATGVKRVGHAGTLDPMATGVLVIAVGRATRLLRYIQDEDKEYEASVQFGVATDTLDADGAVVEREPMDFGEADLSQVMERFRGTVMQVPPMVSAVKHEGKRLYELARAGEIVEREARPVQIHDLELLEFCPCAYPEARMRVVCGKGTYVRVLADDLAQALGGRAHLTALRRTRVGALGEKQCVEIGDLDRWQEAIVSPAEALSHLPAVIVDEADRNAAAHGATFAAGPIAKANAGMAVRVLGEDGRLVAVYRGTQNGARAEVVLG
jgi:tRNA pseudouridine55 synthase